MKLHPSLLDLLCTSLLTYILITGLTLNNTPGQAPLQTTPDIRLPTAPARSQGTGGVDGKVVVSLQKGKGSTVRYVVAERPVASLAGVVQELRTLRPGGIIIKGDKDLPLEALVRLLVQTAALGIPMSLAYNPAEQ